MANWRRGPRIQRPADFTPTDTKLTPRFTYYLDTEHGYLKQMAVRRDDPTPTTFYQLLSDEPPRRNLNLPVRPLKVGLLGVVAAALVLVLYPFYPAFQFDVREQVAQTIGHTSALAAPPPVVSADNRVIIPKIGVNTSIVEGTSLDVLNSQEGVWHQTGAAPTGNLVLAGHRFKYFPPNTSTLYNLAHLTKGDTIIVDWYHSRYVYVVDSDREVAASDTNVLSQAGSPRLTIYTCANVAQTERTVVVAHLQP